MHKLTSKTKRIGGGFGGKETRSIFIHCAAAVPAYHLRRPVKAILDRDEDMQMTGGQQSIRFSCVCLVLSFHGSQRLHAVAALVLCQCTTCGDL
jgi:xanthine dehydrogenase molybdopterin-binding subunit B